MLKAPSSAFTIENLWRHCDKWAFKHSKWAWYDTLSSKFPEGSSAAVVPRVGGSRVRGLWLRDRWSWDGDQRAERSIDENWTDECRSAQISQSRDPAPSHHPPHQTLYTAVNHCSNCFYYILHPPTLPAGKNMPSIFFYLHFLFAANSWKEDFHWNEWITKQHINF